VPSQLRHARLMVTIDRRTHSSGFVQGAHLAHALIAAVVTARPCGVPGKVARDVAPSETHSLRCGCFARITVGIGAGTLPAPHASGEQVAADRCPHQGWCSTAMIQGVFERSTFFRSLISLHAPAGNIACTACRELIAYRD
jgi:hypothetical protein